MMDNGANTVSTYISVMMIVEFHSEANEIQLLFASKSTDFLVSCKTTWVRAIKNWAFSVFKVRS